MIAVVYEDHAPCLSAELARVVAGDHVDHVLADVRGLVGHALEASRDGHQRRERLERDEVFRAQLEELIVDDIPQRIHLVFAPKHVARERLIAGDESLHRVAQHRDAEAGDLLEPLDGNLRAELCQLEDLPRDTFRVIADALQLQRDADGDVGKAQAARDGLLADEKFQAEPIEFLLQFINAPVAQNHRVRKLPVARGEGLDARLQCTFRKPRHLGDLVLDAINVVLERVFVVRGHQAW